MITVKKASATKVLGLLGEFRVEVHERKVEPKVAAWGFCECRLNRW